MTDPLTRLVRDMLDGRQNDEEITVSVSLLWSLDYKAEEPARADTAALVEAARAVVNAWDACTDPRLISGKYGDVDAAGDAHDAAIAALRAALEATDD